MAICPNCANNRLFFNIASQTLKCDFCDSEFDPYDKKVKNGIQGKDQGYNIFTCPQCGGEIFSTEHDLTGNCSFCGSAVVFQSRFEKMSMPGTIIPFKITKDECKQAYLDQVSKAFFAPKALKDPDYIEGFRGIYMPYWLYGVKQNNIFNTEATYSYDDGSRIITQYYDMDLQVDNYYKTLPHDASSIFADDLSERVEPFNIINEKYQNQLKKYAASYLSGFYAESPDTEASSYDSYARDMANEATVDFLKNKSVASAYDFDIPEPLDETLGTQNVGEARLSFMPVWFLSYKNGNRVAYATVNGQTGRVSADIPVNLGKFCLFTAMTALVLFGILNLFFTLKPGVLALACMIFGYVVFATMNDTYYELISRDFGLKDKTEHTREKHRKIPSAAIHAIIFICLYLGYNIFDVIDTDNDYSALTSNGALFIYSGIVMILTFFVLRTTMNRYKEMKHQAARSYPLTIFAIPVINAAATIMALIAPPNDVYYYSLCLLQIGISLINLLVMLGYYNTLATRRPPQFIHHEGGEDHA